MPGRARARGPDTGATRLARVRAGAPRITTWVLSTSTYCLVQRVAERTHLEAVVIGSPVGELEGEGNFVVGVAVAVGIVVLERPEHLHELVGGCRHIEAQVIESWPRLEQYTTWPAGLHAHVRGRVLARAPRGNDDRFGSPPSLSHRNAMIVEAIPPIT